MLTPLTTSHLTPGRILNPRNHRAALGNSFAALGQLRRIHSLRNNIIVSFDEGGKGRHSDTEAANLDNIYNFYDFLYRVFTYKEEAKES